MRALVFDLSVKARVVITQSDVLGDRSWKRDFRNLADACVALEEVGLIPPGDAAFTLGNNFKDGLVVSEDGEVDAESLFAAGFRPEKTTVIQ